MQCPSQMDTFEFPQFKCLLFEGKGNLKMVRNYFFLQWLGNRCRSSVRLADKKISQIPDGDYSKPSDTTNV